MKQFWKFHFNSSLCLVMALGDKSVQLTKDKQKKGLGVIRLLDTLCIENKILKHSDNFLLFPALLLIKTWITLHSNNFKI